MAAEEIVEIFTDGACKETLAPVAGEPSCASVRTKRNYGAAKGKLPTTAWN
jgi:hypothetical protein